MRTLLFCTAWADSTEALDRRLGRWLRHHAGLPWPCEVRLAVATDGLPANVTRPEPALDYLFWNHEPHLGRPAHLNYPGWWRSFTSSLDLARMIGAERIWHVESDFLVTSSKMIERLDTARAGWTAFWCPRHNFPETAIQVIGGDRFEKMASLKAELQGSGYRRFIGRHAEEVLPFDTIDRSMNGDRYGEAGIDPKTIEGLDFYGQAPDALEAIPFDARVSVMTGGNE